MKRGMNMKSVNVEMVAADIKFEKYLQMLAERKEAERQAKAGEAK